jgi:uncharacterized membrane-anchored protein
MKRSTLLLVLMAVAQLGVLAWTILGQERILKQGEVFLFKTAPIDPRDPFRGEYVRLDLEAEEGPWPHPDTTLAFGAPRLYARLGTDAEGFARITALHLEPPTDGPYLKVKAMWWGGEDIPRIMLPFDRYYLQEGDGPKAEKLLRPQWNNSTWTEALPAHAVVRVLDGEAAVADLIVDGKPLREWLE